LIGTVAEGAVKGVVRLTRGRPRLSRFLGTYRTADGDVLIILDLSRLGVPPSLIDVGSDGLHGLYQIDPTTYAVGAGQDLRNPVAGNIRFAAGGSSLTESFMGAAVVHAMRMPFHAREVRFRNGKVPLAGTLLLPEGTGPFPAVVMAHGAGPSLRDEGQAFSNLLAAHGIASLTMDKRGEGESGGAYLGDFAGEQAIAGYASDVVAGGKFLGTQPAIDPHRIGLFGGSQAGWVIPRAAATGGSLFSFGVILSGPVVSQGESDYYASLCYQGNQTPNMTPEQIDAAVRAAGPSGVDPQPDLRRLSIPIFWVYGGLDQNQPTRLDIPALERLKAATGADFSWVVFPAANHGLVDTRTGLNSEAASSPNFARGLFASLVTWLRAHSLGS
jgi:dienelactone hydrolase